MSTKKKPTKKLTLKSPWAAPARRKPRDNPRVACGTVSASHNKFVGATIFIDGKKRKVIGCAISADGKTPQYATRAVGSTSTRYTPKPKRALRDLKYRKPSAVKLFKHSKEGTQTPAALIAAFEKKYGKTGAKAKASTGAKKPKKKLYGAALAAHNAKRGK